MRPSEASSTRSAVSSSSRSLSGIRPEPHGRRDDPLLEVERVEGELVAEELDDVLVPRGVVRLRHGRRIAPGIGGSPVTLPARIRHGPMRRKARFAGRVPSGPAVRSVVRCPGRSAPAIRTARAASQPSSASRRRPRASSSGAGSRTPRAPAPSSMARRRRTTRSCSATCRAPARRSARPSPRASASACTATTTPTASARPRSPSRSCASSAPTSTGTCRTASTRATGCRMRTIDRFAKEGCGLVLTVDCGITAVDEVAAARARGLEVIVTDHHRPGDTLPDCPIVATRPSDYPFPELCGTGVVLKLGQALLGADHPALERASRPRRDRDRRRRRPARRTRTVPSRARACARSRARRSRG